MDRIHDRDIPRLWAEHYPKSKTSGASKCLCMAIALMLEDKAPSVVSYDDPVDKLHCLLARFRIPQDQFYEVEKEIGERYGGKDTGGYAGGYGDTAGIRGQT